MAPAHGALPPCGSAQRTGEIWGGGGGSRGSQGWDTCVSPGGRRSAGRDSLLLGALRVHFILASCKISSSQGSGFTGRNRSGSRFSCHVFHTEKRPQCSTSSMDVAALGRLGNPFPDTWGALAGSSLTEEEPKKRQAHPNKPRKAQLSSLLPVAKISVSTRYESQQEP